MATTKIWSINSRLDVVIDYVGNKEKTTSNEDIKNLRQVLNYAQNDFKTEEKKYVTAINCSPETAYQEMLIAHKNCGKKYVDIAYHGYQSFSGKEVTPEQAHKIGVELANELWGDKFQVVVATHINTNNIHNHIVVCSVSYIDGTRTYDNMETYALMRHTSDELCKENNLSVLKEKRCGKYNVDYSKIYQKNILHSNYELDTKRDVDLAIAKAKKYNDFIETLKEMGYSVNQRTKDSLSLCKYPYKRNIRIARSFGDDYSISKIKERIYYKKEENFITNNKRYYKKIYTGPQIDKLRLKISPMYRKYVYYLYFFKKLPNNYYYKEITFEDRKKTQDFKKLLKEMDFITEHHIDSFRNIKTYEENLKAQITGLGRKRNQIRTKISRGGGANEIQELTKEKDNLTQEITKINQELKMCRQIKHRNEKWDTEEKEQQKIYERNKELEKNNNKEEQQNERIK